jgi:ABC-2 type transport system ATP-binding protein
VLDEPTEGLDPNQRVEIRRLINALGQDRTVLLSTHILSEVQYTCSRLLIINRGKIAADGPVSDLVSRAGGEVRISVEASGQGVADGLAALPGGSGMQSANGEGRTGEPGSYRQRRARSPAGDLQAGFIQGMDPVRIASGSRSLEDLFRQLTATGEAA